jgi:hypothetical protein
MLNMFIINFMNKKIEAIRRDNMLLLLQGFFRQERIFAEKIGIEPSYLSRIKGDQPIGDGIARRIEIEFGKPSGWMDIPSTTQQDHAEYQVMPDTLSEEEKHLLKNFRALSTNQKATLKSVCDALAQTATTKKVG